MRHLRIGEFLVEEGFITAQELSFALAEQERIRRRRVGEILVDMGALTRAQLDDVIAAQLARLASPDGVRPLPLGAQLIEDGLIDEPQLARALAIQERNRRDRLGDVLVHRGILDRASLERAILMQLEELSAAG
jgi:hypothetical protein